MSGTDGRMPARRGGVQRSERGSRPQHSPAAGRVRRLERWAGVLFLWGVFAGACGAQTTVMLRGSIRTSADAAIRVGDVAVVSGDDAERVAKLVVAARAAELGTPAGGERGGWIEYSLQDLCAALNDRGVNLGRTTLRGSVCAIRVGDAGARDLPAERGTPTSKNKPEPAAIDFGGASSVRHAVGGTLARFLNVDPADLRVAFDAADEPFLSQRTTGLRVDVQPAAAAGNEVLPLRVYVYRGERLIQNETVSVRAHVRRAQITAAQTIDRREVIGESMVAVSEAWVSPSVPAPAPLNDVLGTIARSRIGVGQVLTASMLERPVLVKKGEKVEVHCLSGTVTLKATRARALADGREGEYISLQMEGAKKSFTARVSGRGLAVRAVGAREE